MNQIEKIKNASRYFRQRIYVFKILLLCIDDQEKNLQLDFIEKICNSLFERLDNYDPQDTSLYNNIINDYEQTEELLSELKEDVSSHFKIASVVILDNMKLPELEQFYEILKNEIAKNKTLANTCDYIYYHSGKDLSKLIVDLLDYIDKSNIDDKTKKLIPVAYLSAKTNIITLYAKEWIEIFQNIRLSMKYLNSPSDSKYQKIKKQFDLLSVYYFIIITGEN